jgi:sRNA-binding protein
MTSLKYGRALPREQLEGLVELLAGEFPKAFFLQPSLKQPLKKNVILDLAKANVLDDAMRAAALSFSQGDLAYERCLQAGAARIDLHGREVGTVTESEQREAQARVRAQKAALHNGHTLPDPVAVTRALHDAGEISNDMLSKITAPPRSRPPMKQSRIPKPVNHELTRLRSLWSNLENVSRTRDTTLRSALTTASLKVLIDEAAKVITALDTA